MSSIRRSSRSELVALRRVERRLAVVKQLGVGDDRGEWRLQLVRRGAQELVLQPADLGQLLVVGLEPARAVAHALERLGALDRGAHVLGERGEQLAVALGERLGVVDAVDVEHADAALADPERDGERRGDVAVVLVVAGEVVRLAARPEQHRLAALRHPAGDALAEAGVRVARELGLEAVGGAGVERAGLGVVDHHRGLLRAHRRDHATHDDLEHRVEPHLDVEPGGDLEQPDHLVQPAVRLRVLPFLVAQRASHALQLEVLHHGVGAEHQHRDGHAGDQRVRDPERIAGGADRRHVEHRNRGGEREHDREGDDPQRPAPAVDLFVLMAFGDRHGAPPGRRSGRGRAVCPSVIGTRGRAP